MCSAMRWNHLPVSGALGDQHPEILEKFMYIFGEQSKVDKRKQEEDQRKQERERRSKSPSPSRGGARPRRR